MNGKPSQRPRLPASSSNGIVLHPTFQKVLLILIAVVIFDAHYVYKFFSDDVEQQQEHASAEVGVVHLMSSEKRGLKGGGLNAANRNHLASSNHGGAASSSLKRPKLEPSWKTDKRMNPAYASAAGDTHNQLPPKKHKLEPSWKTDRRMNPMIAEPINGYQQHQQQPQQYEEQEDHLGISSSRFNSLDPTAQLEELSLEVQLWKGRYEMTAKKLHRLEQTFENAGAEGSGLEGLKDHEVHALMYEGLDVEAVNVNPGSLTTADDGNELYDPYKTDVFDHATETYGVDEHILKILRAAGVEIDEELASILPTWEDIVSMYGDKPIISGLETCEPYRESVRPEDRMTGPAGMFNTGTNLLFELMKVNCDIKEARMKPRREPKHNGMRWQAPWGKHNPPSTHRNKNVAKAWGKGIKQGDFMPVVLIKDPYTWMGSQCRHKYSSFWGHDENHCPNLIRWKVTDQDIPSEVIVKFALEMKRYESLLDMWNSWYFEWEQMTFPHLVTRFEDLLFHGEEVVKTACECVGGVFTDDFMYVEDSAKPNTLKVHKGSNGLVQAMVQYGDPAKRLTGFTERDMIYADKAMNKALMEKYGYRPPPPLVGEQE